MKALSRRRAICRSCGRSSSAGRPAKGPPPNRSVDVYRLGWVGDYVDAMNFLELWTCDSGNNNTNYCNEEYDRLVDEARKTPDNDARYELYGQLEEILFGPEGDVPFAPIYYYTNTALVDESIMDTFNINLLDQIDLTEIEEGDAGDEEGV